MVFWAVSVKFGQASGAQSILDQAAAPLGIMAVAVALLMIGGEFDLFVGAATARGILTILLVRDVAGEAAGAGFSLGSPFRSRCSPPLDSVGERLRQPNIAPELHRDLGVLLRSEGRQARFLEADRRSDPGRQLDDLAIYAEENGVSDKGYGLLDKVFAGEWIRNEHVWDSRDWVYPSVPSPASRLSCSPSTNSTSAARM